MAAAGRPWRIGLPDLVSPSYFPAIAAVEMGCLAEEGVDATIELVFPVVDAAAALRDGELDFLAGAAHAPLFAFPNWDGAKLLMALSRNMYWFLVVRPDIDAQGVEDLLDVRIGAAPGPDLGLMRLLDEAGIDPPARGISIGPVPTVGEASISFGVMAARALAAGTIDGFWANGMGAELAVREGTGRVLLDARRGDGPPRACSFTFPALATTDRMIQREPELVDSVVRALTRAQSLLRDEPARATPVGERVFPPLEASMIAELIERDAPFYEPGITREMVDGLSSFAVGAGLLRSEPAFERIVAVRPG